jgi:2'-5' RNA ligase
MGKRRKREKMRLFIGVPLELKAQEKLAALYKNFNEIKTVKTEYLHVTMQFLGEMDEEFLEPVKTAIDKACDGFKVFEISNTRISAFPNLRKAKAVWVNVDKGSGPVKKLFRNIEKSIEGIKYERENRAFIPHVTIGRSKQGVDISAQAAKMKFEIISKVCRVVLYKSDLEPAGPVYTKIHEVVFGNNS